ncbi:lectin kinase [Striga asiatica]|uniref:non-specific serine/threonine protein kinase n=1 Tax=Striga asiatica TaxID=4170 RepID=A0A5A7PFS9_STRAF|nr:lectin kinase [Striga asiatica]
MESKRQTLLLPLILAGILSVQLTSAVDFLFNGFNAAGSVSLYGTAAVESNTLSLTQRSSFSIGRALYPSRIPARWPNSSVVIPFSTSFIFAMAPYEGLLPGHGLVFLFVPHAGIEGSSSAQNLGFLNFTNNGDSDNHVLGVEFDCFMNQEFNDISDNHVGVDVNSLVSVRAHDAGYYVGEDDDSFEDLDLNSGRNYQVWIDYVNSTLNVAMAPVGLRRPDRPLLSVALNLSEVFEDEMYVGFTASTGDLIQSHRILGWSFSNTNFSLSEGLITEGLPSFVLPGTPIYRTRGFIAGLSTAAVLFAIVCSTVAYMFVIRPRRKKRKNRDEEFEDWELEYWPHRINYEEIDSATKGFAEENAVGTGGNGKVYRGILPGGAEIAVKHISHENDKGTRAFLAEISSLGRVKHRNLVSLRGWCKKDKNSLFVVYDYMENGSLDKRVFESDEEKTLSYEDRIRILKQVASGLLYLHEGWEATVLHRDIKASNVLLDQEMNARLGDFGLARMHDHDKTAGTTRVVGTAGYLAPEFIKNGRASTKTDVFSYGVLILEVVFGRRPVEEGQPPLVDWVWGLLKKGELLTAVKGKPWLRNGEEIEKVIHLGLLCAHPDANTRPSMRQVVKFFEGKSEHEEGGMDVYLLERLRGFGDGFGSGSYPTFSDIRRGAKSSISISWSDSTILVAAFRKPAVFCIITEYLPEGSLRAYLHKYKDSLPMPKLISMALDIAKGMEYIHSQGVIHRDLKPENILITHDFHLKVADFGIACEEAYCDLLADDPGTYRWMAPEMIKRKKYGRKVDVYGFGLILWELVAGAIPYEDMTPIQAAFAVVNKNLRPAVPKDCAPAMKALIEQCWSLHPDKRPEFWQIVKVLEEFDSSLALDGTLNLVQNPIFHDPKKGFLHWIQKLGHQNTSSSGPKPKFT